MTITGGIALYFIVWWLTLFAILPIGVRSQEEAGEVVPGSEIGAPAKAQMGYKVLLTTLVSIPVFLAVWYGSNLIQW
jgi:predicted secreted protein